MAGVRKDMAPLGREPLTLQQHWRGYQLMAKIPGSGGYSNIRRTLSGVNIENSSYLLLVCRSRTQAS